MKLNEKIYTCRKKAGLSQEALADRLGVSRQAVSKWETGEAEPEISKLRLLAEAFNVTTDWLLSDEDPEPEPESGWTASASAPPPSGPRMDWLDTIPGVLGRLCRRFGWLAGVYIALCGLGVTFVGGIARYAFGAITSVSGSIGSSSVVIDGLPAGMDITGIVGQLPSGFGYNGFDIAVQKVSSIPVTIATVILVIGLILLVGGAILAVVLKQKSHE